MPAPRPRTEAAETGQAILYVLLAAVVLALGGLISWLVYQGAVSDGIELDRERAVHARSQAARQDDDATHDPEKSMSAEVVGPVDGLDPMAGDPEASTVEDGVAVADAAPTGNCIVRGKVLEIRTGAPAVGMEISAVPSSDETGIFNLLDKKAILTTTVNTQGEYELFQLPHGTYTLRVDSGDSPFLPVSLERWPRIDLDEGELVEEIDFEVERGGRVIGTVTETTGEPVEGASVKGVPIRRNFDFSRRFDFLISAVREGAKTDEDGRFVLGPVPLDKKLKVQVSSEDHATRSSEPFTLTAEQPEIEVFVSLEVGSTIRGHVRTPSGDPAVEVTVYAMPTRDITDPFAMASTKRAKTDEQGAFELRNVAAGKYNLRAGNAFPTQLLTGGKDEEHEITVDGVETVQDIVLEGPAKEDLDESGTITGTVRDRDGNPLAAVEISTAVSNWIPGAKRKKTKTDAVGNFTLEELVSSSSYTLVAKLDGYAERKQNDISASGEHVEIILDRLARISGFVVTRQGETPGSFQVRAVLEGAGQAEALQRMMGGGSSDKTTEGNEDGTFVLENVPLGTVLVEATARGYAPARSAPVSVVAGEQVEDVEIVLDTGTTIRGRVVDSSGAPIRGANVTLSLDEGEDASKMRRMMPAFLMGGKGKTITSNAKGEYEIEHVAETDYEITATHPDFAAAVPVKISASGALTTAPDLVLATGASLTVRVTEGKEPKPGIMVQAYGPSPLQMATTGDDGVAHFDRLLPGDYTLNVIDVAGMQSGRGMRLKNEQVTIQGEEHVEIEIEFGAGYKVHGTIEGLEEDETSMITLRRPGGPAPEDYGPTDTEKSLEAARFQVGMAFVGGDGKFSVEDLEPGVYILEIPNLPKDLTDVEAMQTMDRRPRHRQEIEVVDKDVELTIRL